MLCEKKIMIEFDGVINNYKGWKDENELFSPNKYVDTFLTILSKDFDVNIFTSRDPSKVYAWLKKYNLHKFVKNVTNIKEPAFIYVDDRAVKFDGDFFQTINDIKEFRAYWQRF
jgi:hypothetical protein